MKAPQEPWLWPSRLCAKGLGIPGLFELFWLFL